ncbi:uncharacterized protein IL334_003394 [Kwoniella shivajii]|uniref:SUZ domain-containing protein n=1 Tax=Kwoniella shivajii TaxID=564305 RepID=A0ABZ1CXG8_9TREE|nr:hypothetical protein IL334_003394 [Kwoniella shivajii]
MPPNISSPTLATPRPSSLSLKAPAVDQIQQDSNSMKMGLEKSQVEQQQRENQVRQDEQDGLINGIDGRITPTADSHSNPSLASSTSSNLPSPNPTTISLLSQSTNLSNSNTNTSSTNPPTFTANISHPAEFGLGTLQVEDQMKLALQSKDRIFLLVLSKEFESFINKLSSGQITSQSDININTNGNGDSNSTNQVQTPTTSTSIMAALGPSISIGVTPTSKFQRMLVYKTAEWYGLKAVPAQEGGMIVGVLGTLNEKSTHLKLSELVPAAPSTTQKFRIMQRAPPSDASGSSSPSSTDRAPKWKTLEEREAAYAAAREKIYGKSLEAGESINGNIDNPPNPPSNLDEEEIDPVPRQLYTGGGTQFEVVYPSLYHPPKPEPHVPPPNPNITPNPSIQYQNQSVNGHGYQSTYAQYPQQVDMNGYPIITSQAYASHQMPPPQQQQQQQQSYGVMAQGYMDNGSGQGVYTISPQQNGYAPSVWQQPPQQNGGYIGQVLPPNQQQYTMIPPQQNGMNIQQGWQYPAQMMSQQQQQLQLQQQHRIQQQPMPMIPQGMQYNPSYGYPSQPPSQQAQPVPPYRQASYPPLAQPTPMRPTMQPHSSASSSISSRSYQDGSRPHSRGSTTSTRSAASSVRLGAMYPASQGPGYRQKAMKGQGMNGLTSLGLGTENSAKRNTRGQSPSSTTTTSSRSSRRTSSIQLAPPSSNQHQLPQRPDWAANNVPYHPSPLPIPGLNGNSNANAPSAVEFPPLLRQGQGTNAEPMQVERVKMKPSVWNGTGVRTIQHNTSSSISSSSNGHVNGGETKDITILPSRTRTPGSASGSGSGHNPVNQIQSQSQSQSQDTIDPDFPRRVPTKSQPTLFDPSTSTSRQPLSNSRPSSVNTNKSSRPQSALTSTNTTLSPEEIIEAKLAQVSINNGVPIGAPASSSISSGGRGGNVEKSYAKVVRRI